MKIANFSSLFFTVIRGTGLYVDMEFWTEVRRQVLVEGLSKRGAVKRYGISWHTLQKILDHEEPPGYRQKQPRSKPKIAEFLPIIAEILKADQKAPRKQRHSAKRIFDRLKTEHGFTGGYTIVKDAVRTWKQSQKEVFLPLVHRPGEAQVDFGFARVWIRGQAEPIQVAMFVMTLPYSGAVFCQVFHRECTESFLEGHRRAFEFFGGVPWRISYDNSKVAIAKIIGSRQRQLTREFLRLQSHYLFEEHFCLVRRPNEKGHVEKLLDYARSNFLVPVPVVDSLEELNEQLIEQCRRDQENQSRGKSADKHSLLGEERSTFLALPARAFEARRITQAAVCSQSLVRFDRNSYSVPTKYAHRKVTVVATVDEVRLVFGDRLVAVHRRCWQKEQFSTNRSTILDCWNASQAVLILPSPSNSGNCQSVSGFSGEGWKPVIRNMEHVPTSVYSDYLNVVRVANWPMPSSMRWISESTTPTVSASSWSIAKRNRQNCSRSMGVLS